ncbi:MAG: hypothetical protein WC850_04050 [Candidatus Gracilibacteria bacterium]
MNYLDKISKFNEDNLPSLDEVVLGALELFEQNPPKKLDISEFKKPLVAGSGNAIVTARNIFSKTDAIFCDETTIDQCLKKDIDGLIICSASGEKHAIIFAEKALKFGIKTKLLTCNPNSTTSRIIGKQNTVVTLKNREPYTYNTSTYMGWIFALTGEKAGDIIKFIENDIDKILKNIDFSRFDSYLLITPDIFSGINQLFTVKFIELFGRKIARDVFSYEHLKHAITVVPHDKESAISFGKGEFYFEGNHINFPLPLDADLGSMMAIGYYVIGKIQNSYSHYFKKSIAKYIENVNKTDFGKGLKVIVE